MELSGRSIRLIRRLVRRPFNVCAYRNVTGTAVKEEVNTELLSTFNQDLKAGGVVPVFRRALLFPTRVALQDDLGTYTYAGLFQSAAVLCNEISAQLVGDTGRTIPYMCNNDASHVIVQWAIWMSGNIAVPLTPIHPPDMLKYYITDCMADLIVCNQDYEKVLRPLSLELSTPLLVTGKDKEITAQLYELDSSLLKPKTEGGLQDLDNGKTNAWYGDAEAMIIYTSGTTSKPKGVVWSHSMLQTQISALHAAWQYSANDVVLHALPLHHIHGQLNSLNASLAAGCRLHMLSAFSPHVVWAQLVGLGNKEPGKVSVIHGVPAHYHRLVSEHGRLFAEAKTREYVRQALSTRLRLAAVGSAPCHDSLARSWQQISGVPLLERYGMSEVGMALSNPYRPVEARSVGHVGLPLPGVTACIARVEDSRVRPLVTVHSDLPHGQISLERLGLLPKDGESDDRFDWKPPSVTEHEVSETGVHEGELLLKGPAVFIRYWNRAPKLEDSDFIDGWFRTGDTAAYSDTRFKILGRTSVDIIKTGGYKISALQVESALLDHPSVADVAVIGIDHEVMGEVVAAVVVLKEDCKLTLRDVKENAGKKLASYQLPRKLILVDEMPRNAMGKLDKKEIKRLYGNKLRSERIVEK